MELKLRDTLIVPIHWGNLFKVTAPAVSEDIERVLREEQSVFDREWYQTTHWGRTSFSMPSYRQHWILVQIKTEPQRKLAEMLVKRYDLFKITDMKQFALSLKIEYTQKSTKVFTGPTTDLRTMTSILGQNLSIEAEIRDQTSPLLGYDVLSAMVVKQKFKVQKKKEMCFSADNAQYTITSKTLKEIKALQKSYSKSYEKANWYLVARGLIHGEEFWSFKRIKNENVLKGVSW